MRFNLDLNDKPELIVEGSRMHVLEKGVQAEEIGPKYGRENPRESGLHKDKTFTLFIPKHLVVPYLPQMRHTINITTGACAPQGTER